MTRDAMSGELVPRETTGPLVPALIAAEGDGASHRFFEFFTANIENDNTRMAYAQAVAQFLRWAEARGLTLRTIEPIAVVAYVRELKTRLADPSVKQHLAAVRMLFDWLVTGQVLPANPTLSAEDARKLLDSIDTSTLIGLRDRALIAKMVDSLARISAVVGMKGDDYYQNGKRWWLRLHEKGGKFHELPAHHNTEAYLDAYIKAAGIGADRKLPLFRSIAGKGGKLPGHALRRNNALDMVKRRALAAGLSERICCHTFRATGITAYLEAGGTIEKAQQIAAHESPKTSKLYDRTNDQITLDEIERIVI